MRGGDLSSAPRGEGACALRALHAMGQGADLVEHAADRVGAGAGRAASRLAASVSISAEATTAASATRTASAAWSGVRTPKPMAIGRSVARRIIGIASASSSAQAVRVPVTPVMLT